AMLSSSSLVIPRHPTLLRARPPRVLAALLALCLLIALAPVAPWRAAPAVPAPAPAARWGAPQALAPIDGGAAAGPLSSDRLPDGLYPAMLATLERTAAP